METIELRHKPLPQKTLQTTGPLLVSILGLPCSGTTILNKFVNSIDNGFMLCEPMWIYYQQEKNYDNLQWRKVKWHIKKFIGYYDLQNTNKPTVLELSHPDNFSEEIYTYASKCGHLFAGLKETYDNRRPFIINSILSQPFSLHLFSFREPTATFNSWKKKSRHSCYKDVEYFIDSYNSLYEMYLASSPISRALVHESFCEDTLAYWNKNLQNSSLQLERMPDLSTKSFNASSGNKHAIRSNSIESPSMDNSLLTSHEKARIEGQLSILYKSLN